MPPLWVAISLLAQTLGSFQNPYSLSEQKNNAKKQNLIVKMGRNAATCFVSIEMCFVQCQTALGWHQVRSLTVLCDVVL